MSYAVVQAPTFWDCYRAMRRDDPHKAALMDALAELEEQPFRNPRLQTHDVGRARNGKPVFSSDVGGRGTDRRLVWQLLNETVVVLLYGTHAVQERAKRMRIDFDVDDRVVVVVEERPDTGVEERYERQRVQVGKAFMAWTDAELAGFGFTDDEVARLRAFETEDDFLDAEASFHGTSFERAFNLLTTGHPEGDAAARAEREAEVLVEAEEPEVTEADRELERQLQDVRAGAWFTRAEPEFLQEVIDQPIEDWMIFLHPDQRVIVRRNFDGPARVRGSAGTGKTVVGLHRAAHLAERARERGEQRPILFTTFIKSLPPVFERLYLRIPGTQAGEVEFVHIDRLASSVCATAGDRPVTAPREVDKAFKTALRRIVYSTSPLGRAGLTDQYLRDEITAVIKGRGVADIDTYLAIERTGRRVPLNEDQRRQVWDLLQEWQKEMDRLGTVDFPDVLTRALEHARKAEAPRYSAAIIDEAQDLTLVGLRLVRALVNGPGGDVPNGLLLVGDGAQRIYAGGFTLRQAGIDIKGRSSVLKINYRNTGEIIGAAMAVAGDEPVEDRGNEGADDQAEEYRRADAPAEAGRHGGAPLLVQARDVNDQLDEVVRRVRELTELGFPTGDIGVLVPTNRHVDRVLAKLKEAGIAGQGLDRYDGLPNVSVKVGTYHRGKGLEFKAVLLPFLSKGVFPRSPDPGQSDAEAAEARALAMSQLFVAMTRARDALIAIYDGQPSEVFDDVKQFQRVTT